MDGVSSFGAEEIRFRQWNISACAATANKCLHGVPGTSFVIARRDVIEQLGNNQRSLYLDLNTYLDKQDHGGTPFTQSVQTFYALDEALNEHKEEGGWSSRRKDYVIKMNIVRDGLHEIGIKSLLPIPDSSCVLNSFNLPSGINYKTFHDGLKQRGFVIYGGQGELAKRIFRVSVMGSINNEDIRRFLSAVKQTIN